MASKSEFEVPSCKFIDFGNHFCRIKTFLSDFVMNTYRLKILKENLFQSDARFLVDLSAAIGKPQAVISEEQRAEMHANRTGEVLPSAAPSRRSVSSMPRSLSSNGKTC